MDTPPPAIPPRTTSLLGNFGLLIHLGLYSVPAYDDVGSARRRRIGNGSEWYLSRLLKTYRRTRGDDLTLQFHQENYGGAPYSDFQSKFTLEKFSADEWVKFFLQIRAQYIIITAKHHDGYCLWPTRTTGYSLKRDILGELAVLCKKNNIKFGIYYSILEFEKSLTISYLNSIVTPQLLELSESYNPDLFWFDGDWDLKRPSHLTIINSTLTSLKKKNPRLLINDRIGKGNLFPREILVFGDRYLPEGPVEVGPGQLWQHINTVGLGWGRNRQQEEGDYKSGAELFRLYQKVMGLKGTFSLNLGPNSDGTLDENEVKKLVEFDKLRGK